MNPLRVVVVDDEPLAREGLAELLGDLPGVTVVGSFGDAASALPAMDALAPDVLFVDIQMPGMTGFELVEALDPASLPAIVFVTAYDAHAIRAFHINAVDYLLKPVERERLGVTVDRVRRRDPDRTAYADQMTTLLRELVPESSGAGRLIVREVGQMVVVATRDLDWVEGADYYSRLHVGTQVHLLRESLASLEQRLDTRRFLRIHRSAIVNLARVRSVEAHLRGDGIVVLTTGARLKVTRARRAELERRLEALHDVK